MPGERDGYELVVARALAPLPVALELCLPFAKPGGVVVLPRGSDLAGQLEDGKAAARQLGARFRPPIPLDLPELPPGRSLVVADKVGPTPGRFPLTELVLAPTRVQGDGAPESIVGALRALTADPQVEVVILARGGGSAEDLAAFNDERVARAIVRAAERGSGLVPVGVEAWALHALERLSPGASVRLVGLVRRLVDRRW